jgi:hypothetical protein
VNILKRSFLFILFVSLNYPQELSRISLIDDNTSYYIPSYNYAGNPYISVQYLASSLGIPFNVDIHTESVEVEFHDYKASFIPRSPFLVLKSKLDNKIKTVQLVTSSHFIDGLIFVPLHEILDLINQFHNKSVIYASPNRLMVIDPDEEDINTIRNIKLETDEQGTFVKILTESRIKSVHSEETIESLRLSLANTIAKGGQFADLEPVGLIKHIGIQSLDGNLEISVLKKEPNIAVEVFQTNKEEEIIIHLFEREDSYWLEKESEHFKVVFRSTHSHLVNDILLSAERALAPLMELFNYSPTEKIIINTYDVSDYGFSTTTTIPQNFIRLEIEPLEPGYEVVPYNERIQWLLNHELVHIVVNDSKTDFEAFFRKIFGKVPPDKIQPSTVLYSLLTNFNRYSPRWHQEAIAVFVETWFSGGYGRLLGSFDEMYFRSLVVEGKEFPLQLDIETIESHNSMFLDNLFYIYGGRFVSYLSIVYGADKVLDWFTTKSSEFYTGFEGKFEKTFGKNFSKSWKEFIEFEKQFQKNNIDLLNQQQSTSVRRIGQNKFGWITSPQLDKRTGSVIFGYHRPHQLANIQSLKLNSGTSKYLTSLPTPSMLQVASTAYDEVNGLLFFTTNNNQLFRDIWVYDIETDDKKMIFENARVGELTINSGTHDLWGVEHDGGVATIVISPYPYREIIRLVTLPKGDEIFNLSLDHVGENIAAVLKKSSGQQSLIIFNGKVLIEGSSLEYSTITSTGAPENPSWSKDSRYLYWNAFTNGVSNVYRFDFANTSIKALTHCVTGLVKPLEITRDSILAFEFTTDGFAPVLFKNEPAPFLPAINYLGQQVIEKEPKLYQWALQNDSSTITPLDFSKETGYNSFTNLNIQSIVPVLSGFQNQVVFGLFTRISDPLLIHDFYLEAGVSPLKSTSDYPFWHLKLKYDYRQLFYIEVSHNGPDFFDLFNDRKRGMMGTQIKLGHTHYWKYDNPHKIKQTSTLSIYRGVEFINDNLVRVSQPDFAVLATNLNSKNLRKSIGSSDYESGNEINWTFTLYGTNFDTPLFAPNTYIELSDFSTWLWNHNVLHVKFAGGYLWDNEQIVQARYYFGGFGNRGVDNAEIKQFRKVFRYPGIPIYSLMTDKFGKLLLENDFPPIRLSGWSLGYQFVNHIDFALYSQGMYAPSEIGDYWIDIGAQMDIKLKHWYNLESTISAGIAKAWSNKLNDWEWFLSIKILKD